MRLRHRAELREQLQWYAAAWQSSARSTTPSAAATIVVGPWLSEVGYETLYWFHFFAGHRSRFRLDSSRVVAVSRGGSGLWYEGIAVATSRSGTRSTPLNLPDARDAGRRSS
jgi:hypothetical protein